MNFLAISTHIDPSTLERKQEFSLITAFLHTVYSWESKCGKSLFVPEFPFFTATIVLKNVENMFDLKTNPSGIVSQDIDSLPEFLLSRQLHVPVTKLNISSERFAELIPILIRNKSKSGTACQRCIKANRLPENCAVNLVNSLKAYIDEKFPIALNLYDAVINSSPSLMEQLSKEFSCNDNSIAAVNLKFFE